MENPNKGKGRKIRYLRKTEKGKTKISSVIFTDNMEHQPQTVNIFPPATKLLAQNLFPSHFY